MRRSGPWTRGPGISGPRRSGRKPGPVRHGGRTAAGVGLKARSQLPDRATKPKGRTSCWGRVGTKTRGTGSRWPGSPKEDGFRFPNAYSSKAPHLAVDGAKKERLSSSRSCNPPGPCVLRHARATVVRRNYSIAELVDLRRFGEDVLRHK